MAGLVLNDIVQVTIDKQTKSISKKGFGTVVIVGPNPTFGERLKYYTQDDLTTLASELTGSTSAIEYLMAVAVFARTPSPTRVAIGREDGGDADMQATLNAIVLEQPDFYIITLESTDQTKQEDADTWALANERIFVARSDDTNIINRTDTQDSLDTAYLSFDADLITGNLIDMTVNGDAMTQVPFNTDHDTTMADIITQLESLTNVTAELDATDTNNRTLKIVKAGATIAITGAGVSGGASQANITIKYASIAAKFKADATDRSGVFYHSSPTTEFPDASFASGIAVNFGGVAPGSYTGAFKTLTGVAVTNLTTTQSKNARDKNANTYEEVSERNIVYEGTTGDGDYFDVTVFADWVKARIQETVYGTMVNVPKIPYTEDGYATIKSDIDLVLNTGLTNGGFSPHLFDAETGERKGGFVIILPEITAAAAQDKIDRIARDIKFTGWLAGAIHKTIIAGTLTV